ncbi:hypothetical protein FBUS_10777 [Fasciolopsis buskii]|uniref:Uncharacterized protein n=1 Tax=Fasciolopsis buskii TaxID=27845 RepID=A0A8E0VPL5_9TREM|nr:hypothetical protein FBUS_10777 [Fasciolopsis buski]
MSPANGEAERLVRRVDQGENISVTHIDWRELLLFYSADDVAKILEYWRHDGCLDIGNDAAVGVPENYAFPEKKPDKQIRSIAEAVTGAVSCTCTVPINWLKLIGQARGYGHKGTGFIEAYQCVLHEDGWLPLWVAAALAY